MSESLCCRRWLTNNIWRHSHILETAPSRTLSDSNTCVFSCYDWMSAVSETCGEVMLILLTFSLPTAFVKVSQALHLLNLTATKKKILCFFSLFPNAMCAPLFLLAQFDSNGDGQISLPELREAMKKLMGEQVTNREINEILQDADLNGDGQVDFEGERNLSLRISPSASSLFLTLPLFSSQSSYGWCPAERHQLLTDKMHYASVTTDLLLFGAIFKFYFLYVKVVWQI